MFLCPQGCSPQAEECTKFSLCELPPSHILAFWIITGFQSHLSFYNKWTDPRMHYYSEKQKHQNLQGSAGCADLTNLPGRHIHRLWLFSKGKWSLKAIQRRDRAEAKRGKRRKRWRSAEAAVENEDSWEWRRLALEGNARVLEGLQNMVGGHHSMRNVLRGHSITEECVKGSQHYYSMRNVLRGRSIRNFEKYCSAVSGRRFGSLIYFEAFFFLSFGGAVGWTCYVAQAGYKWDPFASPGCWGHKCMHALIPGFELVFKNTV